MTGSVPRPGRANTERLAQIIQEIVSGGVRTEIVLQPPHRVALRRSLFALIYGVSTILVLGGIVWLLHLAHFSLVGGFFFIVFLGLVSFLGLRLRSLMRELRVVSPRDSLVGTFVDFLTLPVIDLGRQISLHVSSINVFLFLLDAVIEAPFKLLVGLVEEWFSYLRERKEELL